MGHPYYGQLAPVKTRYSLTTIRDRIAGSSLVWAVWKPVNANPGLKVFLYTYVFTAFVLCSLRLSKLKTKGQTT